MYARRALRRLVGTRLLSVRRTHGGPCPRLSTPHGDFDDVHSYATARFHSGLVERRPAAPVGAARPQRPAAGPCDGGVSRESTRRLRELRAQLAARARALEATRAAGARALLR